MKVAFVITHLGLGGAERVAVQVAEGLADCGHSVYLYILNKDKHFYRKPEKVKLIYLLDETSMRFRLSISRNIYYVWALRKKCLGDNIDVAVGFLPFSNVRLLLSMLGTGIPVVVTEHCMPHYAKLNWVWKISRRYLYPLAKKLVSVSKDVDNCFRWLPEQRRKIIYNPLPAVVDTSVALPLAWEKHKHWVVVVGRLTKQKRFDLTISAFSKLTSRFPAWGLAIIGSGELQSHLTVRIKELGLDGRAHLFGPLNNPFGVMSKAEFLVLNSESEGFGNVLIEAMAVSTPCISVNCPGGPKEIIDHNVNGLLVPPGDQEALIESMAMMMGDKDLRKRLSINAASTAKRFELSAISSEWQAMLRNCL